MKESKKSNLVILGFIFIIIMFMTIIADLSRGPIHLTQLLESALLRVGWVEPRCPAAFCIPATYSLREIDKDNRFQKLGALDSGSLWPVFTLSSSVLITRTLNPLFQDHSLD